MLWIFSALAANVILISLGLFKFINNNLKTIELARSLISYLDAPENVYNYILSVGFLNMLRATPIYSRINGFTSGFPLFELGNLCCKNGRHCQRTLS